jgi:O-antigen/teichoic acid export membrane protein
MNGGLGAIVSRNVIATLAVRAFYMVTRFIIPPFVLGAIGLEAYGLVAALFVVVGYIGVSVIGFSGAYVKYTAEFHATGDFSAINELLSTGLAITVPAYGLAFCALWWNWNRLYAVSGLPSALEPQARSAALLIIGSFLVGVAFWGFADLLNGLQHIHTMQMILLVTYAVETVLIFVLVGAGRGVQGLAEAFVARTVLSVAVAAWVCFRTFPWLRISPSLVTKKPVRLLLRFGGVVQVQSTLSIVLSTIERALAIPLLGSTAAGVFDLAKKLPAAISDLTGSFFTALMPAASYSTAGNDGGGDGTAVRSLYMQSARYSAMLSAALCAIPVCFAGPLMSAWIGKSLPGLVQCSILFGLAMQVHLLTGPGTSILRGMGRLSGDFYYLVPNLLILALSLAGVYLKEGFWTLSGIAVAVSMATVSSALVFLGVAHKLLSIPGGVYAKRVAAPCAAPYGIAGVLGAVLAAVDTGSRWQTAGWLVVACVLHVIAVSIVFWNLFLDHSERLCVHSMWSRVTNRVRKTGHWKERQV